MTAGGGRFDKADVDCTGALTLPEGKLFVAVGGPDALGDAVRGAVTGGTGEYAGATGTFSSPETDSDITHDTFTIYVPEG